MRLIRDLKIKHKLMLMLFFPFMGLIYFASSLVLEKAEFYLEMKTLEENSQLSLKITDLIYHLQHERVSSLLYLQTPSPDRQNELNERIGNTEKNIAELQQLRQQEQEQNKHQTVRTQVMEGVEADLEALTALRKNVMALKVNQSQAFDDYSVINQHLIDLVIGMAREHRYAEFLKSELAYLNVATVKEKAALERSLLVRVFKQRYFDIKEYNYFLQLVNEQDVYLADSAKRHMTLEQQASLEEIFANPQVKEVERLRQFAYAASVDGIMPLTIENAQGKAVDLSAYWHEIKTAQVDLLDNLETMLSQHLTATTREAGAAAYTELILISISTLMLVLIALSFAYTLLRGVNLSLDKAVNVANSIAQGNLNNQFDIDNQDETGQLLHVLDNMQQQLRERIEREQTMAEAALRINEALDNVTTSVLIADNDYKIIYLNKAAQRLFKEQESAFIQEIPHFRADDLLNQSVDILHKNPQAHRRLLSQLKGSEHARLDLTTVNIEYFATPVINQKGQQLAIVKEFKDRTIEVFTEQEINHVIHAASQGDFSGRINLENKTGFFRSFAEALNQILDYNELAIKDLMKVFSALSKGDLTLTIENNYLGSLDQLKQDINTTIRLLNEVLITIQQSASAVSQAAEEISQGHISLSQRTEEQAASLEETAASMEEMTSTVQQNADNARQATQLASSARTYAEQGSKVVNNAVTAMAKINDSSKKIADIIGVIDDIAFQTNLLALNAAVEAARAGEQGRGFAVVATEVRNLAQRSATAAKEIKNLIRDSVNKVEEGTSLVNQSGETLTEIVTAVKKVSDIIAEIAAASQEQSSGIQQVNKAVAQMDEMTQQNAALVEEATAAGESMSHESQNLREQVGFFIINSRYSAVLNESSNATPASNRLSKSSKKMRISEKKSTKPALSSKQTAAEDGWEDF